MKSVRQQVKDSSLEPGWSLSLNILFLSTSGSVFLSSDTVGSKGKSLLERSSMLEIREPNNETNKRKFH